MNERLRVIVRTMPAIEHGPAQQDAVEPAEIDVSRRDVGTPRRLRVGQRTTRCIAGLAARFDRSLLLVLMLAALVVIPRSALIATAHSESIDDEYHLVRGVRFLLGTLTNTPLNDPPLGEAILALPLWIAGAVPSRDWKFGLILHGQRVPADVLLMYVAMFKSLLFVPFVAFCFAWIRRLYDARAGWAAAILLLIEPTITAHVTPAALDVPGFEAIGVACFLWWGYFKRPTWGRLTIAAVVTSAAMLIKHTAIVLPIVALGYAVLWCGWRRDVGETIRLWLHRRWIHAIASVAIAFAAMTILSGGFVDVPRPDSVKAGTLAAKLFDVPLPAGYYFRSLQTAERHGEAGHPSWLLGHRNDGGSLAYYPVVAYYKVPIGLWVMLGLGVVSLAWVRPRFEEWALVVPIVLLWALLARGGINIGFRHAIAPYGLMLLLSTRALLIDRRWATGLVACTLAVTALDATRWFPNYISYTNWRRDRVWMKINDSNLDWGQGLKQVRVWIDTHPKFIGGRPVAVRAFGLEYSSAVNDYIGSSATVLHRNEVPPHQGLLIVSPVYVVGLFEEPGLYDFLREEKPIAQIGDGSNLVFDLDALEAKRMSRRSVTHVRRAHRNG